MSDYLIIGPSKAGKTALLATLYCASINRDFGDRGCDFTMHPRSDAMAALINETLETVRRGRLPITATNEVTEYTFDLSIRKRNRFGLRVCETATFRMWDGPGGSLFPRDTENPNVDAVASEQYRARLTESLASASGFVLCLDPSDADSSLVMFEQLPAIMFGTGCHKLPAARVAVALTKTDRFFLSDGRSARSRAEETSARRIGGQILTSAGRGTLRSYCSQGTRIAFGWCSAYGFLRDGQANYDLSKDCLRVYEPGEISAREVADKWRPYRILDPFVFLATGESRLLEVIKASGLK